MEVLAEIPPTDLLVRDRAELTKFARGEVVQVGQEEFDAECESAGQFRLALRKRILREWNARWQSSSKGPTTRSFFPSVQVRLKAKGTWERDTVAVLVGHGNFGQQLLRIGQENGAKEMCRDCPGQRDSAEHRIRACPHFEMARTVLSEALGADVSVCPLSRVGRLLGHKVDPALLAPFNERRDVVDAD